MTIKMHLSRSLVVFFLLNAGVVFAGEFQSKVITTSPLTITVPEDRFLRITNFTQEGGTDRGVVGVTLSGDTGGTANVLTATRIDFSTGINSQNFPEIGNQAVIAGNFTEQDTKRLAVQLGSGALPFDMQMRSISILRGDFGSSSSAATPTSNP